MRYILGRDDVNIYVTNEKNHTAKDVSESDDITRALSLAASAGSLVFTPRSYAAAAAFTRPHCIKGASHH